MRFWRSKNACHNDRSPLAQIVSKVDRGCKASRRRPDQRSYIQNVLPRRHLRNAKLEILDAVWEEGASPIIGMSSGRQPNALEEMNTM